MNLIEKKIRNLNTKTNVTRDELQQLAVQLSHEKKNIFFNWGTRLGKSKCIMEIVKSHNFKKVLFVCSQNIHIQNFKDDCQKFGFDLSPYVFICWNSYHNYEGLVWDAIIQDEVDHSINNHIAYLSKCTYSHVYFLTATINQDQESKLRQIDYFKWSISSSQAMDWQILPLPTVYLKPIIMSPVQLKELQKMEERMERLKEESLEKGWYKLVLLKGKKLEDRIKKLEYELKLKWKEILKLYPDSDKENALTWEGLKVLKKGGERKKFFENIKMQWFEENGVFNRLKEKRTIFFLPDITDNKKLGNAVSSLEDSKTNTKILDNFNSGKIDYIISKKILVRGVNVINVNWGYFGVIDLNGTSLTQSTARVLLGISPYIFIPFVKGTKEEQVIIKFLKSFKCTVEYLK